VNAIGDEAGDPEDKDIDEEGEEADGHHGDGKGDDDEDGDDDGIHDGHNEGKEEGVREVGDREAWEDVGKAQDDSGHHEDSYDKFYHVFMLYNLKIILQGEFYSQVLYYCRK